MSSIVKKINIAVIFGGRSGEHEVSLVSADAIIKNLDKSKYNVIPVGITKDGQWIAGGNSLQLLKTGEIPKALKATLTPDTSIRSLVPAEGNKKSFVIDYGLRITDKIDVVFPVLHGTYGEDGTIQGLFELADLPYVGSGVLGSATAMDKITQKKLCQTAQIPIADWIWLSKKEWLWLKKNKNVFKKWLAGTEKRLKYPMFIKPSNLGSSVGISKVKNRQELVNAINLAAKFDRRVVIEKGIKDAMEIEVAVIGNEKPEASAPGQIIPSNEFYDYKAKYVEDKSEEVIPAPLSKDISRKIQDMACEAFKLLDCAGMARVDFFVTKKPWKIYLSELNTIPGFTPISMYPKLWQASGVSYSKLLDILIKLAMERYSEKRQLQTGYKTVGWYR
ncbi:MAG: D-alanine--D-alanine ligase family protein [Candidatus Kuenenbacteria bacterium]